MADYDRACLQSWLACGFRVLAMNGEDEIPLLRARFPEVEFVPAPRTARAVFGRDTPFIADMAAFLAGRTEAVLGIINSDLLFEPDAFWRELPDALGQKTVLTGQRYDLRSLSGVMHVYTPGFDYFFFGHEAAAALATSQRPFSMGLPWWDYWCPLSLAQQGYRLRCLTRPAILHLQHDQQVNARTSAWRRLAREFARAMLDASDDARLDWKSLIETSRALDNADDAQFDEGAFDETIIGLSANAIPLIASERMPLAKGQLQAFPATIPADAFINVGERVAAGTALVRGLWDENHDNLPRAQQQMELALRMAPQDPTVLFEVGNFFYRLGNMQAAAAILSRAEQRAPRSSALLNALGSALGRLNRNDEAAACFEKAIVADPLFGGSYFNLAMALSLRNRHEEAVRRLERQIALAPEFPDGALWLSRIRDALSRA